MAKTVSVRGIDLQYLCARHRRTSASSTFDEEFGLAHVTTLTRMGHTYS